MKTMMQNVTSKESVIRIYPAKVHRYLMYVILTFSFASLAVQFSRYFLGHRRLFGLTNQFYLDNESNIPTYFSAIILLTAAILLITIATLDKRQHKICWKAMSFIFLYISMDEILSFHEELIQPLGKMFHATGLFYFAWVIPGMAIIAVLGLIFLKFLIQLPKDIRLIFVLSAVIYVGGALGVELIGGFYAYHHGLKNFTYSIITTIEETMEMSGVALFIYALLQYLKVYIAPRLQVHLCEEASLEEITEQLPYRVVNKKVNYNNLPHIENIRS